jgi:hypothetical protein
MAMSMFALSLLCMVTVTACDDGDGCLEGAFGGQCDNQSGTRPKDVLDDASGDLLGDADALPEMAEEVEAPQGTYPQGASDKQVEALEYVNEVRFRVGLGPINETTPINDAAQAHAEYYALHVQQYQSTGLSPHEENPSWSDGFTAVSFFDRMREYGYEGYSGFEIIAFYHHPRKAVQGWMDTLYHRIPIVYPDSEEMGYGAAGGGGSAIDVIDFGVGSGAPADSVILYPWEGQTDVPLSWNGMESPQPPIPPGGYPSGPIITVTFGSAVPHFDTHELLGPNGRGIEHIWLTPTTDSHLSGTETVSLYSHAPLDPGSLHTVRLIGAWHGEPYELEWSFTTQD